MTRYDQLQAALTDALAMRGRAEAMGSAYLVKRTDERIASLTRALVRIAGES